MKLIEFPTTNQDISGFGDGSDGALVITAGNTVNLSLNHKYQYSSVDIQSGGTLSTTDTSGSVLYILCQGTCKIDGSIVLNGKIANGMSGDSVVIDGITFNSPSTQIGGGGASRGGNQGSSGGQSFGFGGGGGGGGAYSPTGGDVFGGGGGNGGTPGGSGGIGQSGNGVHYGYDGGLSAGGSGGGSSNNPSYFYTIPAGGNAYGNSPATSSVISKAGAGGSGGSGGIAGTPGINLFIKAQIIHFTGSINVSGGNGGNGGWGGQGAAGTGCSADHGNAGGGGGGGNAGAIVLGYTTSIFNPGTIFNGGGSGGDPGSNPSGNIATPGTAGSSTPYSFVQYDLTNPANAYSDDSSYATCTPDSGVIGISLSKDGGTTWSTEKSLTFTSSEVWQTVGDLGDPWSISLTGADLVSSNFLVRLRCGTSIIYQHAFGGFNFGSIRSTETVSWLRVSVKAKYNGTTTSVNCIELLGYSDGPFPVFYQSS